MATLVAYPPPAHLPQSLRTVSFQPRSWQLAEQQAGTCPAVLDLRDLRAVVYVYTKEKHTFVRITMAQVLILDLLRCLPILITMPHSCTDMLSVTC
jgi:hypothetical protein